MTFFLCALAAKGLTIAVIDCSLDRIYPAENRVLAENIVESGGPLVSKFPLGTAPDKQTFPMRNRSVSGLSHGLVVVEAGRTRGALITACMELDPGRPVFAVPGRIDQPTSAGRHQLSKEGAKLVESVEDILGEFDYLMPLTENEAKRPWPEDLSDLKKRYGNQ